MVPLKNERKTTKTKIKMRIRETIKAEAGKCYLSEVINELPNNCLFDKGKVGCGGTTIALESSKPYIICVPFIPLMDNKISQYPNNRYSGEIFGFYSGVLKRDLDDYVNNTLYPKIMVTYNSLEKLMNWINPEEYSLLVDELHILFTQYSFRREAAQDVLNNYKRFNEYCFMTATPLDSDFMLEELLDEDMVICEWEDVREITVQSTKCIKSVESSVELLINDFLCNKYDGNAYFFVNSVDFIKNMVSKCDLNENNTRVIYSKSNQKQVGIHNGLTTDAPKRINFLTSTCFEGADILDEDGYVFVVSDSSKTHTLLDISTSMLQISGRIRNTKHWDKIVHLFTHTRYSVDITYEEFKDASFNEIITAKENVIELNNIKEKTRENVSFDGPYLSKINNLFVFDPNLVKIDLYNFKITSCIYKLRATIRDEYTKNGFNVEEYNIDSGEDKVIVDKTAGASFKDIVINLSDMNKLSFEYIDLLNLASSKYNFIRDAINLLGFEELKNCNYHIGNIKNKLIVRSDKNSSTKIFKMLNNKLNLSTGEFIKSSIIKERLSEIYNSLGIDRKAKATDILNYYDVRDGKEISKRIDGNKVKGYLIIRSKVVFKN